MFDVASMFPVESDRLPDLLPALICVLANAFFCARKVQVWGNNALYALCRREGHYVC